VTVSSQDLQENMFRYYDERAQEYDEIYTLGKGSTAISDPNAYTDEVGILSDFVRQCCQGRLLDLPCGTGFWLPHYARTCESITLLDQSSNMLAQCRQRVGTLGIEHRCALLRADVFAYPFRRHAFDCALVGFFLSHLDRQQERALFALLRTALKPGGKLLILDSAWSEERARTRPKAGRQTRVLNDGRSFEIYKRYLDASDIGPLAARHAVSLSLLHQGRVFLAILGQLAN
jgi:ubiquinone/menaquinone biosynthesis C-methylase UbiE